MNRADLEAAYWRLIPRAGPALIDALLRNADDYAAAAERRAALAPLTIRQARDRCRAVHLSDPGTAGRERPACRVYTRHRRPVMTADPRDVTCQLCIATAAYETARLGVAS